MLALADPGLPAAATAKLGDYQDAVNQAGDYEAQVDEGKRLFRSYNRVGNSTFEVVRHTLKQMCNGLERCAYCEDSAVSEIEHIKPKDLYPEKVFQWSNYLYACGPCNRRKGNRFAIVNAASDFREVTRSRNASITPPPPGKTAFLDLRAEDPLEFLTMDLTGTFRIQPRADITDTNIKIAQFTIDALKLNRDPLPDTRRSAFSGYRIRLSDYIVKRNAGTTDRELNEVRDELLNTPHPTVWEEMKRQADDIPALAALFAKAPEAKSWSILA